MPDVRALDPTMRQRLAQAFNGDAKPGSIRANLVKGLLGSQTGEDSGLVGMTPLGPIMQAADSSGGRGSLRNTLEAAAGMVPGAKLEGEALERLLGSEGFQDALTAAHEAAGKKAGVEFHNFGWGGTDTGLASKTSHGVLETEFNPETGNFNHTLDGDTLNSSKLSPDLVKKVHAEVAYDASRMPKIDEAKAATLKPSNLEKQVGDRDFSDQRQKGGFIKNPISMTQAKEDAASNLGADSDAVKRDPNSINRDRELEGHIEQIQDRAELAKGKGMPPGTRVQDGDTITPADDLRMSVEQSRQLSPEEELHSVAGGDEAKMNFIKNAMDDEGGNVPEDVAMTLLDHMGQRNPDMLHELAGAHKVPLDDNAEENLKRMLVKDYSIPEMLGMHYDLNPELLSKAYKTPEQMNVRGKPKPTQ